MGNSRPEPIARADAGELLELVTTIFQRCGMAEDDAALLADSLTAADLRGVNSHGVLRVPEYIKKLTTGGVDPRGQPKVVQDAGACLVVDGGNSMGQIGTAFAMERALDRAASTGIAAAAIRGSNHNGAMAYYAMKALPRGMIGLATTNALPVMAPWGGTERLLGINPLGVAIPAGDELPIVYDAAFSGSSHGKIRVYQQRGQRLPEGWALDADGRPTTDPTVAIDGLLAPIGGYKGTALAMIMGIMSSMLSGAAYGTELGDLKVGPEPGRDGHFLLAINIAAFTDAASFKRRVDAAIRQIHAGRKAPGVERLFAPGELEFANEVVNRREGILLNAATLADVRSSAERLGIALDRYAWL
ncbi:MAG TPA: Ldh family oxidoreductase [Thermomicrobiales bacterium]|nr:Ldh family oxidoreductase [Thermomicrobiales bacterium]